MATFPVTRLRRFRRTAPLRSLVRETRLAPLGLVLPLLLFPGEAVSEPLPGLAGISRRSVDELVAEAARGQGLGVGAVLLFGLPGGKDEARSARVFSAGTPRRWTTLARAPTTTAGSCSGRSARSAPRCPISSS